MHKLTLPLIAALTSLTFAGIALPASAADSVWNHNGSQMLLRADGNRRVLSYLHPRRGISARRGDVVFRGRKIGNRYVGTAFTFRRGCRPAPYKVSGVLPSSTRIVLHGASPRRSGCRIIGYTNNSSNSRLIFSYLRRAIDEGYSREPDQPQYQPDPQPQSEPEGPQSGPVETIIRNVPGGRLTFTVQDEDAPAQTPIRIDGFARCDNGRVVHLYKNFRTCALDSIRFSPDRVLLLLSMRDFGGGSCSIPRTARLHIFNICK